ncbi:MAG: hypothetical protein CVT98_06850, partial [Bacteroidetes bacterium HGW-Bacteroidetes-15]
MAKKRRKAISFKNFIRRILVLSKLAIRKAKRISFVGFEGVSIYDVVSFFLNGIVKGRITTRASAVSFDFFIALFPTIIFVFTLIPYIPVENFQEQLLLLVEGILPHTAYKLVEDTLVEVVTQRSWGLLSFGFIAAVFFAHNGTSSLIDAFNATYHSFETRKFLNQHLVALSLTFILPTLVVTAVILILFGETGLDYLVKKEILRM